MKDVEVTVKIAGRKAARRLRLVPESTVADLLIRLEQNRETVVVKLNGLIIAEEERLHSGDQVEILPVVTGG